MKITRNKKGVIIIDGEKCKITHLNLEGLVDKKIVTNFIIDYSLKN